MFKGIVKSDKGPTLAFCEPCRCHFSIRASGSFDIKRHCASQKHKNVQTAIGSSSLTSFMKGKEEDMSVINAEVIFTKFLIERNIPLAVADDAGELFRAMFPKCEEAKKYRCARTKTTAIVHVLGETEKQETVKNLLLSDVFSLSTDGGNDTKSKLFPIIVRYAHSTKEEIATEILSVESLKSTTATGKDIFVHIESAMKAIGLDFSKCVSFSADNASVMVGEKSGVAALLHQQNEHINVIGCPCHRINLAALKAANSLPYKLDQLLIDVYFFLDKSAKRVARLKELQSILGTESHEILKHVNTRWLSLGPCLGRLLEQWEPLSALFLELSEDKSSKSAQSKAQGVLNKLLSPEVKAYTLFLHNAIQVFENANATLQADEPLVHKVRPILKSVVRDLCLRFIKPSAMNDCDILKLDVCEKSNLLEARQGEIDVGYKCKKFVENELKKEDQVKFFKSTVDYFQTAVRYFQQKCNLDDKALIHATIADPDSKLSASISSIDFFVGHFPSLLHVEEGKDRDECMDVMIRQFRDWQAEAIPQEKDEKADQYWFRLSKMQSQCGKLRFNLLSKVMLGILTMFHSNAAVERLFSLVRRNRGDFRQSMSNKLLESLTICKTKWASKSFFKDSLPKELLVKAKSATADSLAKPQ